jgi:hypothetical protein
MNYVESILNRAGLGYIFINQVGYCDKTNLSQILTDQFVSSWYNDIENSSRGQFYGSFKKDFGLENYLVRLNEKTLQKDRRPFILTKLGKYIRLKFTKYSLQ